MRKHLFLFIGIYAGLFVVIFAAILGRNSLQRLKMVVLVNEAEWRATNEKNEIIELPFAIELKSFTIDEYPNGKPKCFTSDITVYAQNGEINDALVKVNKPFSIAGWKIYQYSYDKSSSKLSRYSVLQIVKDPWLPVVYAGFLLIFAGVVFLLFSKLKLKTQHNRKTVILFFVGILLFSFIIARMWLSSDRFKTLMPALRSLWFIPHVTMYMFAYAVFSVSVIYALYLLIRQNKIEKPVSKMALCDNLIYVGFAFLTTGMVIGAIWAKEAWGHYWSWDPKETWALATWLAYFLYIHFRIYKPVKIKTAIFILFFAFLLLQICWVGVKYLPSAKGKSVHVY
jgi:ABC-type transport system involved in cytochrome c biogenesis permease subunit